MINAHSNLFHFQLPIFKNSLSGVYTFKLVRYLAAFCPQAPQETKPNHKKQSLNAFKKILYIVLGICLQNFQHFRFTGSTKFTQIQERIFAKA